MEQRDYFSGKQLEYFSDNLKNEFIDYARKKHPEEACGIFTEDKFIPCENVAENKLNDFKIHPKVFVKLSDRFDIKCIVHSHDSYPHVSKKDMIMQANSGIAWGMLSLNKNLAIQCFDFWGDQLPVQTLVGRKFVFGIYDCFGLVRDYLRTKDIIIPQFPRENFFWASKDKQGNLKRPLKMLEDNYSLVGFKDITRPEIKEGDFFLARLEADIINHCGIYLGGGLILHHLYGRLSCREPLARFEHYISKYLRYVGEENDKKD